MVAFVRIFHCVFSDVSSNCLPEHVQSYIGSIFFFTFLHCGFSNVSSKSLDLKWQSHIGCICLTFLHCAFSNVSSKSLDLKRQSHICFDFSLLSVIKCFLKELGSKQALNCLPEQMQSHIGCILLTFHTVRFQMFIEPRSPGPIYVSGL